MRRLVYVGALLLAAGAVAGAWWWFRPVPVHPPIPEDIKDAEVRQALEIARQQVVKEPNSPEAWGHMGQVLLAHLFAREATICFIEAGRLDPTDPRWPYTRGLIALKLEPDKAVALLKQALDTADEESIYQSAACLALAEALLERSQVEEAEKYFRQEQARVRNSPRAALGLGQIAALGGNELLATKLLSIARDSPSAKKKATALLAALARGRGDKAAADSFEKELALLPADAAWPDPILDVILVLEVGQRGRERRVQRLELSKRYKEAAELYLQQLGEHPTWENYRGAGINLVRIGDFERAVPLLRKGVQLAPDSAQARYSLALGLVNWAEKELVVHGETPKLKNMLGEAIEHARRATELQPDHAQSFFLWGLSLYYLGQFEASLAPLSKGVALNPADFTLQFHLADSLLKTGKTKEAETHFENAHRLEPDNPLPVESLKSLREKKISPKD